MTIMESDRDVAVDGRVEIHLEAVGKRPRARDQLRGEPRETFGPDDHVARKEI
jgi:hypothetical protein